MPRFTLFAWAHRYRIVLAISVAIYGYLGLTRYLGAGRDDVFITLYAAQALADGQGLVNHNGERVEISSSLLHTIIVAFLTWAAPGHVFSFNKLAGLGCGALTLAALYFHRDVLFRAGPWRWPIYTLATLLVAANPAFLYWTLGGLETPYATLLLTVYGGLLIRHRFRPTARVTWGLIAVQCLFMMVRPEGFYLVLFTGIYLGLRYRLSGSRQIRPYLVAVPLLFFGGLLLFRWLYFRAFFPNPVYAKTGDMVDGLLNGGTYAIHFYTSSWLLGVAFVIQAFLLVYFGWKLFHALTNRRRLPFPLADVLLFGLVLAAQLVVIAAGGDWMEHFRFFVPVLPLLLCFTLVQAAGAVRMAPVGRTRYLVAAVGCVVVLYANAVQSGVNVPRPLPRSNDSSVLEYSVRALFSDWPGMDRNFMRANADHGRDLALLEPFFETVLPDLYARSGQLVVATGQMGFFPYRIKQRFPDWNIVFVDTLGLCDRTIARMPLRKDHIGIQEGKFVDEILDGKVRYLSEYVRSKEPNLVYTLGYDPAVERRIATYRRHGFEPVWKEIGAMIFYRERPLDSEQS